jgi:spore coat-associated protein N
VIRSVDRSWLRRLILTGVLVAGAISGIYQGETQAYLTNAQANTGNRFTTGSVTLGTGLTGGTTLTVSTLLPGDSFVARLTVQNTGTLDVRYAMTSSASNSDSKALRDALNVTVRKGVTSCTVSGFSADGTQLYDGVLGASTASFGDVATGAQANDQSLAAGASQELCFLIALPQSFATSATLPDSTTTATFSFTAEQVANNN